MANIIRLILPWSRNRISTSSVVIGKDRCTSSVVHLAMMLAHLALLGKDRSLHINAYVADQFSARLACFRSEIDELTKIVPLPCENVVAGAYCALESGRWPVLADAKWELVMWPSAHRGYGRSPPVSFECSTGDIFINLFFKSHFYYLIAKHCHLGQTPDLPIGQLASPWMV